MSLENYDYFISKTGFDEDQNPVSYWIHQLVDGGLNQGEQKDRSWLVQKLEQGQLACSIKKDRNSGHWAFRDGVILKEGGKGILDLPRIQTKRKTFVSYYHRDDEVYRKRFDNLFNDLVVAKSVGDGDISANNSDEYIKQLIQKDYLSDTTVVVVLVGTRTWCRKHVDWEISGGLDKKIGETYTGLLGLMLPSYANKLPKRLNANVNSGYAVLKKWTDDRILLQQYIEEAYRNRKVMEGQHINKAITQLQDNLCD